MEKETTSYKCDSVVFEQKPLKFLRLFPWFRLPTSFLCLAGSGLCLRMSCFLVNHFMFLRKHFDSSAHHTLSRRDKGWEGGSCSWPTTEQRVHVPVLIIVPGIQQNDTPPFYRPINFHLPLLCLNISRLSA